ncbi:RNA-directed DNA polymerase, eukaryota, reverse transcriptase zinc-binding domain protein, partial [Tanacetum coccineum]
RSRNDSHSKLRRQADDALRKWEAQIDQLRREEHDVSECMMVHTPKNDVHQKETRQIERISSLPEKPNPGSLTIPCSVDMFSINAIADLGASISIMSESILDELSLSDPKHANIIVEMANKTRCVSQGIVENFLVKIDKFSFTSDFLIIDTKELNSKTIIPGRPFLANIHAEINISTREVSLGIKEDRVKIKMKEQECNTVVGEHLNKRPTSQAELSHEAVNKTHWCEHVHQEHEKGYTLWASCDPHHEICDGGRIPNKKLKHYWKSTNDNDRINLEWEGLSCTNWDNKLGGQIREKILTEEQEDPEKCGETKERAIIGAMVNKLHEEWFLEVSRDKDDLEGIIDYNDEAYKQRRNKLLGMPYTEPPPIKKEEAKITKYNLGAGEVFTKTKILNIKEFPRTAANIADIRAEIIEDRNSSSEYLSNTKRRHWCKPIYQWKEDICTKWASCNPHFDECDGGDNPRENKEYWESSNDDIRTTLEWENLSVDNWVRVAFGKNPEAKRQFSRPARLILI